MAEIVGAVLAQQRVYVLCRQPGTGQLPVLELATGDEDPGRMVDQADDPAVPAADRDDAMRTRKVTSATAEVAPGDDHGRARA